RDAGARGPRRDLDPSDSHRSRGVDSTAAAGNHRADRGATDRRATRRPSMTARTLLASICFASLATAVATAQPPAPATTTSTPGQAPRTTTPTPAPAASTQVTPRREGQPINIKVDVTITDMRGGNAAAKKTVSVVAADGTGGFIRSQANYFNIGEVPLN